MKKYVTPECEVIELANPNVVTSSGNDGEWDTD